MKQTIIKEFNNLNSNHWKPDTSILPSQWDTQRLKFLAKIRPSNVDKKSQNEEAKIELCNYSEVYNNEFIDESLDFMEATATEREIERFELEEGDILLTKDSEDWQDIGVPAQITTDLPDVLCGYHLFFCRPNKNDIDPRFLFWVLKSRCVAFQFEGAATGITRYGLANRDVADAWIPIPPTERQSEISTFLDYYAKRIDELINKKQYLENLLEEKRQSVVTRAVTKGIGTDTNFVDPGIERFGEIPQNWSVTKLKFVAEVIDCKHRTAEYVDDGIPIVSPSEIEPGRLTLEGSRETTPDEYQDLTEGGRDPRVGDIIYSRNASLGSAALVDTGEKFCVGQDLCIVRPQNSGTFLHYVLNSTAVTSQVEEIMIGSTFNRINVSSIKDLWVTQPPEAEQREVAEYLDSTIERINELQKEINYGGKLLQGKRQAIITAAVTGQIDATTRLQSIVRG